MEILLLWEQQLTLFHCPAFGVQYRDGNHLTTTKAWIDIPFMQIQQDLAYRVIQPPPSANGVEPNPVIEIFEYIGE